MGVVVGAGAVTACSRRMALRGIMIGHIICFPVIITIINANNVTVVGIKGVCTVKYVLY